MTKISVRCGRLHCQILDFFGSSSTAAHTEQLRPKMFTFVYHWNISHQFLSIQVILRHHQEWHRLQANTELLLRKKTAVSLFTFKKLVLHVWCVFPVKIQLQYEIGNTMTSIPKLTKTVFCTKRLKQSYIY